LFVDPRLSRDGDIACASCHVPALGFTTRERQPSGSGGTRHRRNAPALYNLAFQNSFFLDGRVSSLEVQALHPLLAAGEMGNATLEAVVDRVLASVDYHAAFSAVFGRQADAKSIAAALAAYQRSLVSGNSRFDRWYFEHDPDALDEDEMDGFKTFRRYGCHECHRLETQHALFTDGQFHAIGIGQDSTDLGRFDVTGDPADRFAFRTPSLRNVAVTAPYMHDGSLPTLEAVIDFYDAGAPSAKHRDQRLRPLNLLPREKRYLLAFLRSLSGDNWRELGRDAQSHQSHQ
jgi:cytochrome c peroxidase